MSVTLKLTDILSQKFFQKNTPFESLDDLFSKAGVSLSSVEDYTTLCENNDFNTFIQNTTKYSSFSDMKGKASVELLFGNLR